MITKLWKKWMKPAVMVECYLCEGKGLIRGYDSLQRKCTIVCSKCKGTGVVKE